MTQLVLTDAELPGRMIELIGDACRIVVWQDVDTAPGLMAQAEGFLSYGHPLLGPAEMDAMPNLRVISNFGVGVDHLDLDAALARNIVIGNTPGFVNGATADMAIALVLAIARNVVIGDRYARGPDFTTFNPNILHAKTSMVRLLGLSAWAPLEKRLRSGREVLI